MNVLEYATTQFGNPSATYKGRMFRCTMITNGVGDYVKWRGEHDNPPDVDQCELTKAISVMMKCAREVPLTLFQQIYNFDAATLTSHGLDCVTDIPLLHSVKHGLYNERVFLTYSQGKFSSEKLSDGIRHLSSALILVT